MAEIDALVNDMSSTEAEVARRFLEAVADAADRHGARLAADADASARDSLAVPLPSLWAYLARTSLRDLRVELGEACSTAAMSCLRAAGHAAGSSSVPHAPQRGESAAHAIRVELH